MQLPLHLLQRKKSLHKSEAAAPDCTKKGGGEGDKKHLICRGKLSEFDTGSCVLFHTPSFRRKPYDF